LTFDGIAATRNKRIYTQWQADSRMPSQSALVDRIYEAAVVPELWRDACIALAEEIGAYSASVFSISPDSTYRWISTPNVEELFIDFSSSAERFDNLRPHRALALAPGMFARDSDIMTAEELAKDATLATFIYPRGFKWTVGCAIQEPSGYSIVFDLMRKSDASAFSDREMARLNGLKGDLARAAFLTSRVAFQQARSISNALEMVGLAAIVIGDSGGVITMNEAAATLAPVISVGAGDRLQTNRPAIQAMLDQALAGMRGDGPPQVQSIPVAALHDCPAMILHLLPVRRSARDVFNRCMAVVVVTTIGTVGPPDMRILSGLFDLTPAEARLARLIAGGTDLRAAARQLGLSIETVRTHLKHVMAKTGTRRQAELAVLLSGMAPGRHIAAS
jgi:DNA-binding CsgD family transcriptional regulator